MGSKRMTPEEKAARAARRAARSDRQVVRKINQIAATELAKRIDADRVALSAEGATSKRAHVTGIPSGRPNNPVTPLEEDD